jgi:hypothetical protein
MVAKTATATAQYIAEKDELGSACCDSEVCEVGDIVTDGDSEGLGVPAEGVVTGSFGLAVGAGVKLGIEDGAAADVRVGEAVGLDNGVAVGVCDGEGICVRVEVEARVDSS